MYMCNSHFAVHLKLAHCQTLYSNMGFPSGSVLKNPPAMQELQEMRAGSLEWEHPMEEGTAPPVQYPYQENPMDRSLVGNSPQVYKEWARLKPPSMQA